MKCPNCGKEIANDSVFCEFCGTKLERADQPIKASQHSGVRKCDSGKKYFVYTLSVAMLHIASLCVAYSVHWETFAYYGLGYEGYPGAGEYNAIFFTCAVLWFCSLIALVFMIKNYKK